MCTNPQQFNGVQIPCRKCWQCKESRVDDIVGRCIAEQRTSLRTYTVTLTYGGDDRLTGEINPKARFLDMRDVQLYLKRLRKFAPCRYIAAAEYGDQRGRGHWHLVLFFGELMPPGVELERRFVHKGPRRTTIWSEGFSYWEEATYERMRYACAYVLKNLDAKHDSERRFGASKYPPLGTEWFQALAWSHVQAGLAPQSALYSFPEIRKGDGSRKDFKLTRRSAQNYKRAFINYWMDVHGNTDWPQSDMLDEFLDEECKRRLLTPGDWLEERRYRMKRLEGGRWWQNFGNDFAGQGVTVEREIRNEARHADRIDDRLRTMGNRKGIGWNPPDEPQSSH